MRQRAAPLWPSVTYIGAKYKIISSKSSLDRRFQDHFFHVFRGSGIANIQELQKKIVRRAESQTDNHNEPFSSIQTSGEATCLERLQSTSKGFYFADAVVLINVLRYMNNLAPYLKRFSFVRFS